MQLIDTSVAPASPTPPLSARGAALVGQAMFDVLDRARVLEARGVRVRHLELGAPSEPPPPSVLRATAESLERGEIGYESPAGLPSLRGALAERIARETGRSIDVEQVVVSPANLLINQFLDLACNPGDRIVVFAPAFPTYLAAAAHQGLVVIQIPLDPAADFEIGAAHVEAALSCRPRAVIVNSANNPTGAVYDEAVLHRLVDGCRRDGVWLLSDETYADLAWGKPFASLAGVSSPGLVVMSSLSKVLGIPGFRTGWAVSTPAVAERIARSTSTLMSCLPRFVQVGAEAGLRVVDVYAGISRTRYARTVARAVGALDGVPGLACVPPASAFYLFVDVSGTGVDGGAFAHRLLAEHATAVTPGAAFGDAFRDHVRLALCGPIDDVEAGVAAVAALARKLTEAC